MLTSESFPAMASYDVLSNLIHGREVPEDGAKHPMTKNAIQKGIDDLKSLICGYDSYFDCTTIIGDQFTPENPSFGEALTVKMLRFSKKTRFI